MIKGNNGKFVATAMVVVLVALVRAPADQQAPASSTSPLLRQGASAAAQGATAGQAEGPAEQAERIVSQYKTVFNAPPGGVPSRDSAGGPLLGNGDLGAVISGKPEAQRFWISKNNFWRLKDGHRQGGPRLFGGLEINIPALAGGTYLVEQQLYPAITVARFTQGRQLGLLGEPRVNVLELNRALDGLH